MLPAAATEVSLFQSDSKSKQKKCTSTRLSPQTHSACVGNDVKSELAQNTCFVHTLSLCQLATVTALTAGCATHLKTRSRADSTRMLPSVSSVDTRAARLAALPSPAPSSFATLQAM